MYRDISDKQSVLNFPIFHDQSFANMAILALKKKFKGERERKRGKERDKEKRKLNQSTKNIALVLVCKIRSTNK